jgi:hypothetical protein
MEIIMMLRGMYSLTSPGYLLTVAGSVYALYNRSRAVLMFLLTLFAVELIAMAGALAYFVPRTEYSVSCIAKREPIVSIVFGSVAVGYLCRHHRAHAWSPSLAPIAFELTMLVMTWTKVLQLERVRVRTHGLSAAPPLLFVLVRDGTWTFAAVFRAYCAPRPSGRPARR